MNVKKGWVFGCAALLGAAVCGVAQASGAAAVMLQRGPDRSLLVAPVGADGVMDIPEGQVRIGPDGLMKFCSSQQTLSRPARCLKNVGTEMMPKSVPGDFVTPEQRVGEANARWEYVTWGRYGYGGYALFYRVVKDGTGGATEARP